MVERGIPFISQKNSIDTYIQCHPRTNWLHQAKRLCVMCTPEKASLQKSYVKIVVTNHLSI